MSHGKEHEVDPEDSGEALKGLNRGATCSGWLLRQVPLAAGRMVE